MSLRHVAASIVVILTVVGLSQARELPQLKAGDFPLMGLRLYHPADRADSLRVLKELRGRLSRNRMDVEALRELGSLLAVSPLIPVRQEAARALDRATMLAPMDADLWLRLGLLRQRQKYWSESRRALKRAGELAPEWVFLSDILAQVQLAAFQRSDRQEYFREALYHNQRALLSPEFIPGAYKRQIRLSLMRGDSLSVVDSLLEVWQPRAAQHAWYHLIKGWREFREEDWERAEVSFSDGVGLLPEKQRQSFFTLDIVAPKEQELSHEVADSLRYIGDWWRWRDPTPSDLLNPRHLEHHARMVEAELLFGLESKGVPGWESAPGEMIVRYGLPPDFSYFADVTRHVGSRLFSNSNYRPAALLIRFGAKDSFVADFIDFAMNGTFIRSFNRTLDEYVFAQPSTAPLPFDSKLRFQDIEVWRFGGSPSTARIEIAVALPRESWSSEALKNGADLVTQLAIYDSLWTLVDTAQWDWAGFQEDPFGRLISSWSIPAPGDSLVLGLETQYNRRSEWAGSYQALTPWDPGHELALSDLGFYRNLDLDDGSSPYYRNQVRVLPNPGHVYLPGEPLALGFEAYQLSLDSQGMHQARVSVSVMRPGRKGVLKILMGEGSTHQGLVFSTAGPGSSFEQIFSVDIPRLSKGDYLLEIRVTDLVENNTVALREHFRVDDRIKR